ncbi:hypothetical protein [Pseudoalteromonas xiamenensis]
MFSKADKIKALISNNPTRFLEDLQISRKENVGGFDIQNICASLSFESVYFYVLECGFQVGVNVPIHPLGKTEFKDYTLVSGSIKQSYDFTLITLRNTGGKWEAFEIDRGQKNRTIARTDSYQETVKATLEHCLPSWFNKQLSVLYPLRKAIHSLKIRLGM